MALKRTTIVKVLLAVSFFTLSSLLFLIVSRQTLLPSSHHERMRTIPQKDTVLQAVWSKGHLTRLIDGHAEYRYKKIVKSNESNDSNDINRVDKVPFPVIPQVTPAHKVRIHGNKSHPIKPGKLPGRDGKGMVEENSQCVSEPMTCLQADDLGRVEKERLESCLAKAISYVKHQRLLTGNGTASLTKCSCRLRKRRPDNRRIALISLPGSGNTWVRGLLEHATTICTGAMWCDPNLRATQFCGEGLHGTRTLVVKNHDPTIRWRGEPLSKRPDLSENNKPEFDAAIFLHRNPYDSMVAEHNREVGYAHWEAAIHGNHHLNLSVSHHIQSFGAEHFGE